MNRVKKKLSASNSRDVKKIFHLADIHIRRNYDRYVEYVKVFQRVYDRIRSEKDECIVVVCGDIIHSKDQLNGIVNKLTKYFFRKLAEITDVIVIMGNHDGDLNNDDRNETLTSIVDGINYKKNFHYLRETGIYEYKNIVFGVTSILDPESTVRETYVRASEIKTDKIKIALYHGMVKGAKLDNGHPLRGAKLTAKRLEGYDLVLLGDIHRHQYLNEEKTICYPGSLIQQNYGEDTEYHGMVLWDLESLTSEFIHIHNEYGFCKIFAEGGVIIDEDELTPPEKPKFKVMTKDTNQTEEAELRTYLTEKYNAVNVIFLKDDIENIDSSKSSDIEVIGDVFDIKYQSEMVRNYLEKCGEDEELIDSIMEKNKVLFNTVKSTAQHTNLKWKLVDVRFDNMFCYGEGNYVRLDKFTNIVGLLGPNHTGKSSLFDVILYALFKKVSRKNIGTSNNNGIVINNRKKRCRCEVRFLVNGVLHIIYREVIPSKKGGQNFTIKSKLSRVDIVDGDEKLVILEKNTANATTMIEKLIGKYDDFTSTAMCLQKEENFIYKGNTKKKKFLSRLLGLDIFGELHEKANKELNHCNSCVKDNNEKKDKINIKNLKFEKNKLIEDMQSLKEKKKKLETKNKEYQNKVDKLNQQMVLIDEELPDNLDQLEEEIEELNEERSNLAKRLKKIKKEYSQKSKSFNKLKKLKIPEKYAEFTEKNMNEKEKINLKLFDLQGTKQPVKESAILNDNSEKEIQDKFDNCCHQIQECEQKIHLLAEQIKQGIISISFREQAQLSKKERRYHQNMKQINALQAQLQIVELPEKLLQDRKESLEHRKYGKKCKCCKQIKADDEESVLKMEKEIQEKKLEIGNQIQELQQFNIQFLESKEMCQKQVEFAKAYPEMKNSLTELHLELYNLHQKREKLAKKLFKSVKNFCHKRHNDRLDRKIGKLNDRLKEIKKAKFPKYDEYQELSKETETLQKKVEKLEKQIDDIDDSVRIAEDKIEKYRDYLETYESNREIETELSQIKRNMDKNTGKLINLEEEIQDNIVELSDCKNEIKNYHQLVKRNEELEKEVKVLNAYKKAVHRSGIPATFFNGILSDIQDICNSILTTLTEFTVRMEIEQADSEKESGIAIFKEYNGQKLDIGLCSGFEKFIVGLATRIAITKISKLPTTNMLLIDEGFSCLDSTNIYSLEPLFNFIREQFDFTILISHMDSMKEYCDNILKIKVDEQKFSRIVYE